MRLYAGMVYHTYNILKIHNMGRALDQFLDLAWWDYDLLQYHPENKDATVVMG